MISKFDCLQLHGVLVKPAVPNTDKEWYWYLNGQYQWFEGTYAAAVKEAHKQLSEALRNRTVDREH